MSLIAPGDVLLAARLNRSAILGRLLGLPAYDVNDDADVTWEEKAVDGDDIVSSQTIHYTVPGSDVLLTVVHQITIANTHTADRNMAVHLVPSGGSRAAANQILAGTIYAGETVQVQGPFFLEPGDSIRSISSDAAAGNVALRAEIAEVSDSVEGVGLVVDDGVTLTTSFVNQYACPSSGVQHATVLSIIICNSGSADRTVEIEIRPSGGSATTRQQIVHESVPDGLSLGIGGFTLEPGDSIRAKASGTGCSIRITPVTFTTPVGPTSVPVPTERGAYFHFGGSATTQSGNAYPSGAGFDKLAPGTGPLQLDPDDFGVGTFAIRAALKVSNGSARASIALFDLSDPNTVLTGSEVQGTVGEQTGEIVTSGEITMPDGGSAETLGVKCKTNQSSASVTVITADLVRLT